MPRTSPTTQRATNGFARRARPGFRNTSRSLDQTLCLGVPKTMVFAGACAHADTGDGRDGEAAQDDCVGPFVLGARGITPAHIVLNCQSLDVLEHRLLTSHCQGTHTHCRQLRTHHFRISAKCLDEISLSPLFHWRDHISRLSATSP
jgi:hypothetical protein